MLWGMETIPGRLSRPLAARPGRRAGASGGRPHLWRLQIGRSAAGGSSGAQRDRGPSPPPGRHRHIGVAAEAALRAQVRAHPDATLAEHCAAWAATQGVTSVRPPCPAPCTVSGCRSKKVPDRQPNGTRRRAPPGGCRCPTHPRRLIFVDETSTHTAMTRRRARAPRGERAVGRVPRNHGPNVTLLAALTPAGMGRP